MSKPKAETWVQVYRAPRDPGPNGKPKRPLRDFPPPRMADRYTKRVEFGIEQAWRLVR